MQEELQALRAEVAALRARVEGAPRLTGLSHDVAC
jgi:hypothetical protein